MKKILYKLIASIPVFWMLTNMSFIARAQQAVESEGIKMEFSKINETQFIYGEPVRIYYSIENTVGENIYYYKPTRGNITKQLIDLSTGENVVLRHGRMPLGRRSIKIRYSKPSKKSDYYLAHEKLLTFVSVSHRFSRESLTEHSMTGSYVSFESKVNVLPVGSYELRINYELLPGENILEVSCQFEVLPTPIAEQEALDVYASTIQYALSNIRRGSNSYSANSPESFESFIEKFPNSRYAEYAYANMMNFYGRTYHKGSTTENIYLNKFNEFLEYYPKLKNNNAKKEYLERAARLATIVAPRNFKKKIDQLLQAMEKDAPELSERFINTATWEAKTKKISVPRLKNYAQKRVDNKDKK